MNFEIYESCVRINRTTVTFSFNDLNSLTAPLSEPGMKINVAWSFISALHFSEDSGWPFNSWSYPDDQSMNDSVQIESDICVIFLMSSLTKRFKSSLNQTVNSEAFCKFVIKQIPTARSLCRSTCEILKPYLIGYSPSDFNVFERAESMKYKILNIQMDRVFKLCKICFWSACYASFMIQVRS